MSDIQDVRVSLLTTVYPMTLFGCFLLLDHPRGIETHFGRHVRPMLKYGTLNGVFLFVCFVFLFLFVFVFVFIFGFFFSVVVVVFNLKLESWEQIFVKMCVLRAKI